MRTQGPWIKKERAIYCGDTLIAVCQYAGLWEDEVRGNADIIVEAGTVAHETGLSPRQLADQRADLLGALKKVCAKMVVDLGTYAGPFNHSEEAPETMATEDAIELMEAAIQRSENKQAGK